MSDILELPFDQFQRYRLVADLIEQLPTGQRLRILDVGGRTGLLRDFLPNHRVDLVDVDPSNATGLILGSGAALPFADDAFDVVAAFDTLEHVPPQLRDAFVQECARVAGRWMFLAGPYEDPEVARSEELLQDFLARKIGEPHRYLNEHRQLGLPDRARVESLMRASGAKVRSVGHGQLDRWLLSMCLELYVESDPLLRPLGKSFYRFYNQMVYPHDHGGKVYRHIVMGAFQGAELPSAEQALLAPGLPEASEALLATFGEEMLQVDREHALWRPEFVRLEGIIRDLEKDLAEHKTSLGIANKDLHEHQRALQVTEADLTAHKATLVTVSTDLAEHRKLVAELERLRREERENLKAAGAQAAKELEALREHSETLRVELDRVHRLASDLNQKLVDQLQHNQVVEERALAASHSAAAWEAKLHATEASLRALEEKASRRLSLFKLLLKPLDLEQPH